MAGSTGGNAAAARRSQRHTLGAVVTFHTSLMVLLPIAFRQPNCSSQLGHAQNVPKCRAATYPLPSLPHYELLRARALRRMRIALGLKPLKMEAEEPKGPSKEEQQRKQQEEQEAKAAELAERIKQ